MDVTHADADHEHTTAAIASPAVSGTRAQPAPAGAHPAVSGVVPGVTPDQPPMLHAGARMSGPLSAARTQMLALQRVLGNRAVLQRLARVPTLTIPATYTRVLHRAAQPTTDAPNRPAPAPAAAEKPAKPSPQRTPEEIEALHAEVDAAIDQLAEQATDTLTLEQRIAALKRRYNLKEARLLNAGTSAAKVSYQINPTYERVLNESGGVVALRMSGTETDKDHRTNVVFRPGNIPAPPKFKPSEDEDESMGEDNLPDLSGTLVGMEMYGKPISQDHAPGSDSNNDSQQDGLMAQLPNSGVTKVPNTEKYIKGHLLNDHIGGPGQAFNLFPITADANAKHLAYIEKFIKSSIEVGFINYYRVWISNINAYPVVDRQGRNKVAVDSDLNFDFYRYNGTGGVVNGSRHTGTIQSRYIPAKTNLEVRVPYTIPTEFNQGSMEYDKLNRGKVAPQALGLGGEKKHNKSGYALSNENDKSVRFGNLDTSHNVPHPEFVFAPNHLLFQNVKVTLPGQNATTEVPFAFLGEVTGDPNGWNRSVKVLWSAHEALRAGTVVTMHAEEVNKGHPQTTTLHFVSKFTMRQHGEGLGGQEYKGAALRAMGQVYQDAVNVEVVVSLDNALPEGTQGWVHKSLLGMK